MIKRLITPQIKNYLDNKFPIVVLIGQRRVGKTVELQRYAKKPNLYFDFEDSNSQELFAKPSIARLNNILGKSPKILLLDEIQYIDKIGSILKLIHDHLPHIKVIASGSASFLMMQRLGDSALGRKIIIEMYPLTVREIIGDIKSPYSIGKYNKLSNKSKVNSILETIMIYGALPSVYTTDDQQHKLDLLNDYLNSLLFKDVFEMENIKNPKKIKKLATLLAFQVGSLVNPNELATQLSMSRNTVINYIDLLEKFNIISTITAFGNNPRKELSKPFKVYFTDLGILNSLTKDFRSIDQRQDIAKGGLFENLVFNTIQANNQYYSKNNKIFFWRNRNGFEVDFVITNVHTNKLIAIEVKYKNTVKLSQSFSRLYKQKPIEFHCINRDNIWKYI